MRSRIFDLDWSKFNYKDVEQRKMLAGALQCFLSLPEKFVPREMSRFQAFVKSNKELREAMQMQAFTTTVDFPQSILPILDKFHVTQYFDTGFEEIFDVRDMSGSKRNGFTVHDVTHGLTFNRVKVGEKLKVYEMSGSKAECYFDYYGGALGWHRGLFDDEEWWTIEDNAISFRNVAFESRARVFYGLLEAAADMKSDCIHLEDPGCDDCDAIARAGADALNRAAQTLILNNLNKGYGINPQSTQLIVLTPLQARGDVRRALAVNLQAFSGSPSIIDYNFKMITTTMLTNTNRVLVILPKLKLKAGYRMDLTLFSDFDILSYTDTQAGWMRYGGCIGDTDQIECIDSTLPSSLRP